MDDELTAEEVEQIQKQNPLEGRENIFDFEDTEET